MLKGYKTYITLALLLVTIAETFVPEINVFSNEVNGAIMTILTALAAYFRKIA